MARKRQSSSQDRKWIEAYRGKQPIYERYCHKTQSLVEELLAAEGISYHIIESRAKSIDSFAEKLRRDGKTYSDPLNEITDLVGVRIILYYADDVLTVDDLIENEFVIDREKSIDKKSALAPDQFGYLSVHKIVQISDSRAKLREWVDLAGLKAEIQIRTVLQHSWAAISHALQYKHEADVPDEFRRRLTRLSGLLELADEEFADLRRKQNILRQNIAEKVSEGDLDLGIDAISLQEFVDTSIDVKQIAAASEQAGFRIEPADTYDDISQLVRATQLSDLHSLKELQVHLGKERPKAPPFFREFRRLHGLNETVIGSEAHVNAVFLLGVRRPMLKKNQIENEMGWSPDFAQAIAEAARNIVSKK